MDTPKDHSILNRPFEFRVTGFNFQDDLYDPDEAFIILTLQRESEVKKLKFWRPADIYIEKGFPMQTGGLCILDVSDRHWENINIEVSDFESVAGGVYFYSKSVELLD